MTLSSTEKHRLATAGEFKNMVRMALLAEATQVTFEKPDELTFGSAQARIAGTGRLFEAQMAMHRARHGFASRVINSQDSMTIQAANVLAAFLVEELIRRGMGQHAAVAEGICRKIIAGGELTAQEQSTIDAILSAVISHGFSASAGFNVHAWGLEDN
jgi:hypothetical protein